MKGRFYIHKQKSIEKFTALAADHNAQYTAKDADGDRKVVWKGSRLLGKKHQDVLEIILFLLIKKNKPTDLTALEDLCSVTTSRGEILNLYTKRLSETDAYRPLNPSFSSIWRHLNRLIEANVLTKQNIGGIKFFRLKINHNLLNIINLETNQALGCETTSKSSVSPETRSNCKLYGYSNNKEKEKINRSSVNYKESGEKPDEFTYTENTTKTTNTREVKKNQGGGPRDSQTFFAQLENLKKMAAEASTRYERVALQTEVRKYNAVLELYKEIMSRVFTPNQQKFYTYGEILDHPFAFRKHLPKLNFYAEHANALSILLLYFSSAKEDKDINTIYSNLLKSTELARRTIIRKKYNIDYLTPTKFLKKGKFSLVNVHDTWLPGYKERDRKRRLKIQNDKENIELVRKRVKFQFEADLFLNQILQGASVGHVAKYFKNNYGSAFQNWFADLLENTILGEYSPRTIRLNKSHKDLIDRVINTDKYIADNESKVLSQLAAYMKTRTYTNQLAAALEFKDPMVRNKPVAIRDARVFNDFAYRKLLFS